MVKNTDIVKKIQWILFIKVIKYNTFDVDDCCLADILNEIACHYFLILSIALSACWLSDIDMALSVRPMLVLYRNGHTNHRTFPPSSRALVLVFEPKRRYKI